MSDEEDDLEYDPTAYPVIAPVVNAGVRPLTNGVSASIGGEAALDVAQRSVLQDGPTTNVNWNNPGVHALRAGESCYGNPSGSRAPPSAAQVKSLFPLLSKLRMPSRASLTSVAISTASGRPFLATGDAEGNLFVYHLLNDDDARASDSGPRGHARGDPTRPLHARPGEGSSQPPARGGGPLFPQPSCRMTPFPNAFGGFCAVSWLCNSSGLSSGDWFVACGLGVESFLVIDASGRQLERSAAGSRSVLDTVRSPGHKAGITAVQASPFDSKGLISASRDGTLRTWNVTSARRGSLYAAKHGTVAADSLTETKSLASCCFCTPHLVGGGGEDGVVQLWDCRQQYRPGMSASVVRVSAQHSVGSLLCHANERTLVLRCSDGAVRFVDLRQCGALLAATPPAFSYQGESTSSTIWRTGGPSNGAGTTTLLVVANERSPSTGSLLAELSVAPGEEGKLLRASSVSSTKSVVSIAYDAHADEIFVAVDEDVLLRELATPGARRTAPSLAQTFFQSGSLGSGTATPLMSVGGGIGGKSNVRNAAAVKRQRDDDDEFPFLI